MQGRPLDLDTKIGRIAALLSEICGKGLLCSPLDTPLQELMEGCIYFAFLPSPFSLLPLPLEVGPPQIS